MERFLLDGTAAQLWRMTPWAKWQGALALVAACGCAVHTSAPVPHVQAATKPSQAVQNPNSKPKVRSNVDPKDFVSLALFLGDALVRHDSSLLEAEGYDLEQERCTPMKWSLAAAAQASLKLDWTLFEFQLEAPNPVGPDTVLDAYLTYSFFVFPDHRVRYFMTEGRGSDGVNCSDCPLFPAAFETAKDRFLAAGFGEDCRDAQSIQENELDLEKAGEALLPFIVERVPLRPVCDAFSRCCSPPMPRTSWKIREVRLLAMASGPSGPFAAAAFVVPAPGHLRLRAYDPLYFQRLDFKAIQACENSQ